MRFWLTPFRFFCAPTLTAALAVALLLATLGQSQAADPDPKRVLMLHSFGPRFKPWSDYEQAIRSEISRQWRKPVDFLDQSLVNARLEDENAEALFAEYLRALYASRPVDLIVAIGAPAAAFVQRYRQRLFPATPMVFTAVEYRRVQYEKLTEMIRWLLLRTISPPPSTISCASCPSQKLSRSSTGLLRMRRFGWRRCVANSRH